MNYPFKAVLCCLCLFSFFSCIKENPQNDNPGNQDVPEGYTLQTFTATSEDAKTTIDGGVTKWVAGDQIKVVLNDGTAVNADLTDGAGSNSGTFSGMVPNGKTANYAVYPAAAYASVDGSTVNVTVAAEQPGTFAAGNIAVAKVAADNSMAFKNINSFLVFQLKDGSGVTKVEVTSVDGSALVGTVPVDCSGENPSAGAPASPASVVSMTTNGAGTYYMSIASGATHAKGLKMSYFVGANETGVYYLNKNMTIAANAMYTLGEVETDKNYYVTVAGAGNHTGMDWANAFSKEEMWKRVTLTSTQEADASTKEAKLAAIDGATFHMGHGSYNLAANPTLSFSDDVVTLTFKGGYPAAGGARDLASYRADFTGNDEHACLILRGKLDVTFDGIGFVHGYVDADETASLDCNGTADGSDITVSMSDCVVDNCVNGGYSSQTDQWGAGLLLKGVSSFTAENVTFSNNKSYAVAAAYVHSTAAEFTNCTFSDNASYERAGAVYINVSDSGSASFESCTFSDNEAETERGGAMFIKGGNCTLTTCTFSDNAAATDGGAICINRGLLTINGGTFSGNVANYGGAITAEKDGADVGLKIKMSGANKTSFINNSANNNGGAIWGGTQSSSSGKNVSISDAIFKGNHANNGGACYADGSSITGMYFYRCTFGGTESGDPNYATNNGGSIYLNSKCATTLQNCSITGDYAGNFAGAIYVNNTSGNCIVEGGTIDGCHAKYGGAIGTLKSSKHVDIMIKGATISNCYSKQGGAAMLRGTGIFYADVYNGAGTKFIGNYINDTASSCRGGAIKLENGAHIRIFRASFIGNHAPIGGAISSVSDSGASDLYVDQCSFDRNYVTIGWGACISLDAGNDFCLNNSSFRGSYTTSTQSSNQKDTAPSWICMDVMNGKVSISNCSIIGDTQYSADGTSFTPLTDNTSLIVSWGIGGSTEHKDYVTNCIIVPETAGIAAFGSDGSYKMDLDIAYTHYSSYDNTYVTFTDSGNNTAGKTKSSFDNLLWYEGEQTNGDVITSGFWQWAGTLGGNPPSMITKAAFEARVKEDTGAAYVERFVDWEGSDIYKDQRRVDRGDGYWWPGAYQPAN